MAWEQEEQDRSCELSGSKPGKQSAPFSGTEKHGLYHWTQSGRICREMRVDDGRECKIVHDRHFMETVVMLQLNVATKLFNSLIRHVLQDIPEVQDPLCR